MQQKIFINGRFLSQEITGVQRVAKELIMAIDALLEEDESLSKKFQFVLLTPSEHLGPLPTRKIAHKVVMGGGGHRWEQLGLPFALGARDLLISLCNTGPLAHRHQIVLIHDAAVFARPCGYRKAFVAWYRMMQWGLRLRGASIATVSEFSRLELARFMRMPKDSIFIIRNGVGHLREVEPDSSKLVELGVSSKRYVLAVGSIHPNKNLQVLMEAWRRLSDQTLTLVMVGGDNRRIFEANDVRSIDDVRNILFTGRVTDSQLAALYRHALCFVFPSLYEGFGLPPLEAMTLDCPVISSNAAAMPEVLQEAPEYFSPGSVDELVATLRRVNGSEDIRASMIERGRYVAERYDWRESARHLIKHITHLQQVAV